MLPGLVKDCINYSLDLFLPNVTVHGEASDCSPQIIKQQNGFQ